MTIRFSFLFTLLCCASWAVAQARPTAPPPPPPTTTGASGQMTPPASTIGPPTPITTKAAGPGATQAPPAPTSPVPTPTGPAQPTNPNTPMVPCPTSTATPAAQNNPAPPSGSTAGAPAQSPTAEQGGQPSNTPATPTNNPGLVRRRELRPHRAPVRPVRHLLRMERPASRLKPRPERRIHRRCEVKQANIVMRGSDDGPALLSAARSQGRRQRSARFLRG